MSQTKGNSTVHSEQCSAEGNLVEEEAYRSGASQDSSQSSNRCPRSNLPLLQTHPQQELELKPLLPIRESLSFPNPPFRFKLDQISGEKNRRIVDKWFQMETNRLRYFCLVAELENLRKASELLGLSHSALSKSLKTLQEQVARSLLIQTGRNIRLTEEGRKFYKKAKVFLQQEEALLLADDLPPACVRLGTFEVFSTHLIGSLWKKYFGEAHLELHELLPGQLERALVDQKIDLGVTYEPVPLAGVEYTKIGRVACAAFKRIHSLEGVSFEQTPFVAPIFPIDGTVSGSKLLDGWPDQTHPRYIKFRVDMLETALALVRQGLAAVFIPEYIARLHNKTVREEFRLVKSEMPQCVKLVTRSIYLVTRINMKETSQKRLLAKLLRAECIHSPS